MYVAKSITCGGVKQILASQLLVGLPAENSGATFHLPNGADCNMILKAMEFANPQKGELPDDFSADDSC